MGQEKTPPEADVAGVVKGSNEFALALHRRLAEKSDTNFVLSPFSISTALAAPDDIISGAGRNGGGRTQPWLEP